jgi:enamine deaminase RidA (YjgF/YER057c/UK114 family)
MTKTHLNPEALFTNPAFSQGVKVSEPSATIYVGGQNGVDGEGQLVEGGLYEQSVQAYRNLEAVLAEGGAELTDVVHWRISVVDGQDVMDGVRAYQEVWPGGEPPAITVSVVAGHARPGVLCEIEAVAVI